MQGFAAWLPRAVSGGRQHRLPAVIKRVSYRGINA
jgi:hypothetical protein